MEWYLRLERSTYALENGKLLLLQLVSVMLMLQCGNVIVVAPTYHYFFHSYCHCLCQLILPFLLLHQLLLIQLLTLLLIYIIATYTSADVTIAMYFTKQSTAMSASLVVIYSELLHHFLLLF